ncbi:hypothetical protein MA16_Dca007031 [Dendrobium catenatum]|uniref:Uncharacterized protein n=1 Tax=Dendrobium catenatum TaxID=906689 RepID=A0A2I0VX63_9ASPA|nr:hypothetical protein MA16_Dca007031 [Dendrobium catenatum]
MKYILDKKIRLGYFKTFDFADECSSILQQKLPQMLKDPSNFTIHMAIGKIIYSRILYDLGVSINLIPLSIFKILDLGEVQSTTITLQLVDHSSTYPKV